MKHVWSTDLHDFGDGNLRRWWFIGYATFLATLSFFALAVPDRIFASARFHDVVIFIDGIYRVQVGEIPHLDFSTPLGAFVYCWPQIAGWLPGLDPTLPDGMALLSVLCIAAATWLALSRMTLVAGLLYVTLIGLLVASPMVAGGSTKEITYAMFYNRVGYAMLLLPMVLLLPARNGGRHWLPLMLLLVSTGLVVAYLKLTYFAAWAGIVLVMVLLHRELRIVTLAAVGIGLLFAVAVEWKFPGFHAAYLRDLAVAGGARGFGASGLDEFPDLLAKNAVYFAVILLAAAALARSFFPEVNRQRVFVAGIALILLGSIVVFIFNVQSEFLVLPEGILLMLSSLALRSDIQRQKVGRTYVLLILLVTLLIGTELTSRMASLSRYYFSATRERAAYPFQVPPEISSRLVVREKNESVYAGFDDSGEITIDALRARMKSMGPRQEIYQEDYIFSIARGIDELKEAIRENGSGTIMVMDYSNPFAALLGLRPPKGDCLWYHDGVNVSRDGLRPPEKLFSDVRYVMVPKVPVRLRSRDFLWKAYGDYVASHYRKLEMEGLWAIWVREP